MFSNNHSCLELLPHVGAKERLDVFEAKIEGSKKAGSHTLSITYLRITYYGPYEQ